jgi:hypothetical protein
MMTISSGCAVAKDEEEDEGEGEEARVMEK